MTTHSLRDLSDDAALGIMGRFLMTCGAPLDDARVCALLLIEAGFGGAQVHRLVDWAILQAYQLELER